VTLGLSWFFSRRISRPIKTIAQQIHRISDGDLRDIVNAEAVQELASAESIPAKGLLSSPQFADEDEIGVLTHSFYAMSAYLQNMADMAQKISQGDIAQSIAPRSEHDTLGQAFQQMLAYIRDITDLSRDLADGNLLVDAQPYSDKDVLNHSLRKMLLYIQGVANVAESIADGNLQVQVQPKSELDVLNQALLRMVGYIQDVADIMERIAGNDLQVFVSPRSDHDVLNISLYRMVLNLQAAREKAEQSMQVVEAQNWLKTGQSELNDVMRGEQNVGALAKHIIAYLTEYLTAQVGLCTLLPTGRGSQFYSWPAVMPITSGKDTAMSSGLERDWPGKPLWNRKACFFPRFPMAISQLRQGSGKLRPRVFW
jgi:methyl-accepting chemotaxis protein